MNWIVDNWYLLLLLVIAVLYVYSFIKNFAQKPSDMQIKNIQEWLKWAVVQAERKLGSGTGQLKLRMVYDLAVNKFPMIVQFISFDVFSEWVDEALKWMNKQLEDNKNIQLLVDGGDFDEC